MEIKDYYEILEIDEDASIDEIRMAYRDLIAIWHPDKYVQNKRLYEKATKKTQEINIAFENIKAFYAESNECRKDQSKKNDYESSFDLIECKNCSAKNRAPKEADSSKLICGKCGQHLYGKDFNSQSKGVDKAKFGDACFTLNGIEYKGNTIRYDKIKSTYYYNLRRSLNAMPLSQDFSIKIELYHGECIKLIESADIQPAFTKIPITRIFSSDARKNKKQEILKSIDEIKSRFIYSLAFIKKFSKVEPKEKLPWY